MDANKTVRAIWLVGVWSLALALSIPSCAMSTFVFHRDVVVRDCEVHGCNFEARFDESLDKESVSKIIETDSIHQTYKDDLIDKIRTKSYVESVCSYCGKTVQRSAE